MNLIMTQAAPQAQYYTLYRNKDWMCATRASGRLSLSSLLRACIEGAGASFLFDILSQDCTLKRDSESFLSPCSGSFFQSIHTFSAQNPPRYFGTKRTPDERRKNPFFGTPGPKSECMRRVEFFLHPAPPRFHLSLSRVGTVEYRLANEFLVRAEKTVASAP